MPPESAPGIGEVARGPFKRALERAERAVGVITILSTLGVFGLVAAFSNTYFASWIAIGYFGLAGACEVFHVQRKAELQARIQVADNANALLRQIGSAQKFGKPVLLKQFNYGGFSFNGFGLEQLPVAIGISQPLCPNCRHVLVESPLVRFPGLIRIKFSCLCGFQKRSPRTKNELMAEAAQTMNGPD